MYKTDTNENAILNIVFNWKIIIKRLAFDLSGIALRQWYRFYYVRIYPFNKLICYSLKRDQYSLKVIYNVITILEMSKSWA